MTESRPSNSVRTTGRILNALAIAIYLLFGTAAVGGVLSGISHAGRPSGSLAAR